MRTVLRLLLCLAIPSATGWAVQPDECRSLVETYAADATSMTAEALATARTCVKAGSWAPLPQKDRAASSPAAPQANTHARPAGTTPACVDHARRFAQAGPNALKPSERKQLTECLDKAMSGQFNSQKPPVYVVENPRVIDGSRV